MAIVTQCFSWMPVVLDTVLGNCVYLTLPFFFLPTELTDLPLPPLLFFIFQQPSLVLYTDFVLPEFMFVPDSLLGIQCGQWSESLCANHILFLDVYRTRRPPLHFTYHMLAHKERGFYAGEHKFFFI